MNHRSKIEPKQTSSTTPACPATNPDALVRRGVNLGLIRDDMIADSDRPADLPLGPLLTVREVMSLLSVSRATVYSWVNQQKIPYMRINGVLRFSSHRLDAWLHERERGPRPVIGRRGEGDKDAALQTPPVSVENRTGRKTSGSASRNGKAATSRDDTGSGNRSKTKWLIDLDALRQG